MDCRIFPAVSCMSQGKLICFTYYQGKYLQPLLLHVSYKIKAYTGDPAFLIFCIIPHIHSVFRNLTGFCDFLRSAGCTVQIKLNPFIPVAFQFPAERFCGFLFFL